MYKHHYSLYQYFKRIACVFSITTTSISKAEVVYDHLFAAFAEYSIVFAKLHPCECVDESVLGLPLERVNDNTCMVKALCLVQAVVKGPHFSDLAHVVEILEDLVRQLFFDATNTI